ncbi:hypothetical protein LSTR_LSTR005576 [Laodelphax striatellus]|uniref:HORMA domain-containing protein n=1 Tax=Laodelphax striatellus TaxID=195883 RepID=A0A482WXH1_LAOST|nr:hypothetical protein LSTR_LSTR005576 [Laodelphax striatellus]
MLESDQRTCDNMFPHESLKLESHNILLEVIEVVVHNILFMRKLYPEGVFKLMKKFEVPVHISQHPEINAYICQCLKTMKCLLEAKKLGQVSVVILNRDSVPIEKFVILLQSRSDLCNPKSDAAINKAYSVLRSLIMRMSTTVASLKRLPENCTFIIEVRTTESAMIEVQQTEMQQDFPWVEAETKEVSLSNPNIVPIKNINETGIIHMEVFVEQNV